MRCGVIEGVDGMLGMEDSDFEPIFIGLHCDIGLGRVGLVGDLNELELMFKVEEL